MPTACTDSELPPHEDKLTFSEVLQCAVPGSQRFLEPLATVQGAPGTSGSSAQFFSSFEVSEGVFAEVHGADKIVRQKRVG